MSARVIAAFVVAIAMLLLQGSETLAQSYRATESTVVDSGATPSGDSNLALPQSELRPINPLDRDELAEVVEKIRSDHEKISRFYIRCESVIVESPDSPAENAGVEQWATSGEKRYLRSDLTYADSFRPEPWRLAVWDGETLKGYNSTSNSGTLYFVDDPNDSKRPRTACVYSCLFGHPDRGRFPELFDKVPVSGWRGEWVEEGNTVRLSSNKIHPHDGFLYAWTIDLTRGSCVTKYEWLVRDEGGQFYVFEKQTVDDFHELLPGIWVARAVNAETRDENGEYLGGSRAVASEFKVNDAVPESLFQFKFPVGSEYLDVAKGTHVRVGNNQRGVWESISEWFGWR